MTMQLQLLRFAYLPSCTLGWLTVGTLKLATIERPWISNAKGPGGEPFASCVPDGRYTLLPHTSLKFPETYALENHALGVYYQPQQIPTAQPWGRSAVLIHAGNTANDVIGCIAVGMKHDFQLTNAVTESRIALGKLRARVGRLVAVLSIQPMGTGECTAERNIAI